MKEADSPKISKIIFCNSPYKKYLIHLMAFIKYYILVLSMLDSALKEKSGV